MKRVEMVQRLFKIAFSKLASGETLEADRPCRAASRANWRMIDWKARACYRMC